MVFHILFCDKYVTRMLIWKKGFVFEFLDSERTTNGNGRVTPSFQSEI